MRERALDACRLTAVTCACVLLANCAGSKLSNRFDPRYGVSSSPRVVDFDQPVPKGGGTYRVGKPYVVAGRVYTPREDINYRAEGLASWYGDDFHGRLTANGEVFDMTSLTAAHPTLPMPCYARVTNLGNGKSLIVRVNDRGPYHGNRVIDVSHRAATLLGFQSAGMARVRVEYAGRAPLEGSDDAMLVATLRTGEPAPVPSSVRLASATPFIPDAPPIRGVVRRDVPIPPERPYDLGADGSAASNASGAVETSYGSAVRGYASEADRPAAYRAAGYASADQNSTTNPVLGRGLY